MTPHAQDIPLGFCHCGCGQKTTICTRSYPKDGLRKGDPRRFVAGHQFRDVSSPEYHEEDRGYKTRCWIWDRGYNRFGYGQKRENGAASSTNAHIVYWERKNGPVPDGLDLHHMCRVRACVNPDHVEPKARQDHQQMHSLAKLNKREVREIRDLRRYGMKQDDVAKLYGVIRPTVSMAERGITWSNV